MFSVTFEPIILEYDEKELRGWAEGNRDWCSCAYCRKIGEGAGAGGFGEAFVGRNFEEQGYQWVHHDYDVFGTNQPGKYPDSEQVIRDCFAALPGENGAFAGKERFEASRTLRKAFGNIEAPDIMAWKPGETGLRFAEVKLVHGSSTKDWMREPQAKGMVLLSFFYRAIVEFYLVVPMGQREKHAGRCANFSMGEIDY